MTDSACKTILVIGILYVCTVVESLAGACGTRYCAVGAECDTASQPPLCPCERLYGNPVDTTVNNTDVTYCTRTCANSAGGAALCDVLPNTRCSSEQSPRCICTDGYTVSLYGNCTDINECAQEHVDCGENSTCFNQIGNYSCPCMDGYMRANNLLRESACSDENECEDNTHTCENISSTCKNEQGSYSCPCRHGYEPNKLSLKKSNCLDVNECDENNHTCDNSSSSCHNAQGTYSCACKPGYVRNTSLPQKSNCVVDECKPNPCGPHSTCSNQLGSYQCQCSDDFTSPTGDGKRCETTHETALYIGLGVGGGVLVIIIIIVVVACICVRKKRRKDGPDKPATNGGNSNVDSSINLHEVAVDGDVTKQRGGSHDAPPVKPKPEHHESGQAVSHRPVPKDRYENAEMKYVSVHFTSQESGQRDQPNKKTNKHAGLENVDQRDQPSKKTNEHVGRIADDTGDLYSNHKIDKNRKKTNRSDAVAGDQPKEIIYSSLEGGPQPGILKGDNGPQDTNLYNQLERNVLKK